MTTISQAIYTLTKAGNHVSIKEPAMRQTDVITIEIPFGTNWFEDIEGTGKISDAHYNDAYSYALDTIYGASSQAERITEVAEQKAKNLKDFKNRFFGGYRIPEVREILYNGPATIVFWEDNTKTVVKVQPGEEYYDPDKAFAMAVCKKLFGNKFNHQLAKAQKAYEEEHEKCVKAFAKQRAQVVTDVMEDFRKLNEKWKFSLREGTFDPDSVTTFKPKKEE